MSSRKDQKRSARVVREQLARERRRRRTVWTSVAAVAVLVIAGLVGWGVWASQRSSQVTPPPGAVDGGTALAFGSGPVTIDIYEDFQCPACQRFEEASGATIDRLLAENKVTVRYHPIAILDRASTTKYSTRSAAAAGCAAEYDKYREYAKELFAQQPPEGTAGLTNERLVEIGRQAGITANGFEGCVQDQKYQPWTRQATETASENGVSGTPTVLVNGKALENPTPDNLAAAVADAIR
ncbi:DsbA family protein [Plantactinospora sp. GCM10030261]|uniref:DsbA family protein n=1 Tax=Plantactinospora sp. GCM10030261 TaxID=3273420 RepID=UPI0036208552